jgi:anaerobic magnesium-protoporphyrin IX monomethyl ester cyclase
VRDADILPLYRKAGVVRFLLGTESTDPATLTMIAKGGTIAIDKQAIDLLRRHDIVSMATWVAGFEAESDARLWRQLRALLALDPDQIQAIHATPHRWTGFYRLAAARKVIQSDRTKWDYKHQVMATTMPAWRLFLWVKATEAILQSRPKALYRTFMHHDPEVRHAMRWYAQMGRRVWLFEVWNFLFRDRRRPAGTVATHWGAPQEHEETPMRLPAARRRRVAA